MEHEETQFDDPALKAAARKAWAGESAPAALRARIERIVAEAPAPPQANPALPQANPAAPPVFVGPGGGGGSRPLRMSNWPLFVTAAAAAVLLTTGTVGYRLFHSDRNPPAQVARVMPQAAPAEHVLPAEAVAGMIATHDSCTARPDHHGLPGVAPNDFTRIGRVLAIRVGVPVASMPLDGWTFKGGACCEVGPYAAGHLVYRRGAEALSVFSLGAAHFRLDHADGLYEAQQNGHVLAGFVKGDGLYCVVGSSPDGSLTRQQVEAMRAGFESNLVAAPGGGAPATGVPSRATIAMFSAPAR